MMDSVSKMRLGTEPLKISLAELLLAQEASRLNVVAARGEFERGRGEAPLFHLEDVASPQTGKER